MGVVTGVLPATVAGSTGSTRSARSARTSGPGSRRGSARTARSGSGRSRAAGSAGRGVAARLGPAFALTFQEVAGLGARAFVGGEDRFALGGGERRVEPFDGRPWVGVRRDRELADDVGQQRAVAAAERAEHLGALLQSDLLELPADLLELPAVIAPAVVKTAVLGGDRCARARWRRRGLGIVGQDCDRWEEECEGEKSEGVLHAVILPADPMDMLRLRHAFAILAIALACSSSASAGADPNTSAARTLPSLALVLVRNGMVVTSTTGFIVASDPRASYILVPKGPLGSAVSVDVLVGGARARALTGRVTARAPSVNAALVTVDEPNLPALPTALGHVVPGESVALAVLSSGPRSRVHVELATVDAVQPPGFTFTLARGSQGGPAATVVDTATGSAVGLALSAQVDAPTTGIDIADLRDFLVSAGVPLAPRTAQR